MSKSFKVASLILLHSAALSGCVHFEDYPVGDLCERAERDERGRAVRYPEWQICESLGGAGGESPSHGKGARAGAGGVE